MSTHSHNANRLTLIGLAVLPLALWLPASAVLSEAAAVPTHVRSAANAGQAVWVFLKDKGPVDGLSKPSPGNWISPRAAARMVLRGSSIDPEMDRPVSDRYRDALIDAGLAIRNESRWLNSVSGVIAPQDLDALAALDFVDSLRPVIRFRRSLPESEPGVPPLYKLQMPVADTLFDYGRSGDQITMLQVDRVHAAGHDGEGVRIGFLDTGFNPDVPVFDSLNLVPNGTRDFINDDDDVWDDDPTQGRHGTQTLSTCGGFLPGELIGVAPRAEYVLGKTEQTGTEITEEEDDWVAGLEWLDSMGCDLVSSSLGYDLWYVESDFDGNIALATIAADLAAARGILVINSAGNEGCNGANLIVPADGDSVLAVGAVEFSGSKARFSSCGPTFDGRIKPDVVAPGVGVWTAFPEGTFTTGRGTSYSAPLVTGICALILQFEPQLTPYELIERIRRTAANSADPNNQIGWGLVRAANAVGLAPSDLATIRAWPNPARQSVTVDIPEDEATGTTLMQVFTITGQKVFERSFPGSRSTWTGVTASGRTAAAGVYIMRIKTPVRDEKVKIAWLPSN